MGKPLRVPVLSEFAPRNNYELNGALYPNNPPKDPDRYNCYIEKDGDHKRIIKRYGKAVVATLSGNAVGCQGMTVFNSQIYAVTNNNGAGDAFVTTPSPPNSGTDGTAWTNGSTGPFSNRSHAILLNLNNVTFLIGGGDVGSSASQDVWASDDTITWYLVSGGVPFGVRNTYAGCTYNGAMYLSGGFAVSGYTTTGPQNDVWSSTDGVNWTHIQPNAAFPARYGHTMLSTTAGIFIMGGVSISGARLNDIWFSTDGVAWNQVPVTGTQWTPRAFMMAWYINNALFIGGGNGGLTLAYNDVWYSITGGKTWGQVTAAAWPVGINNAGAVVYNNKMWVFGGYTNSSTVTSAIYSSPDGGTWTYVGATPMGAAEGIAAIVSYSPRPQQKNTIWLIGGDNAVSAFNTSWYGNLNTAISTVIPLYPSTGERYDFQSFNNSTQLLFKSTQGLFVYDQGTVNRVWDAAYPTKTVPGIVVLGDTAYVMDPTGLIYGSPQNNPYHWPPENRIPADYEDDPGVAITKYLTYLVAFGTYTTQFFYDAGVSPGSSLLPYLSSSIKVGCFSAATVQTFDKTVIWMSQNKEGLRQICKFDGLQAVPISTPAIDKYLAANAPQYFRSEFITYLEHEFYLISVATSNNWLTFVYDLLTGEWFRWGDAALGETGGAAFVTGGSANNLSFSGQNSYFLDYHNGNVYSLGSVSFDNDGNYYFAAQTAKFDGGNNVNKFWGPMSLIGDRTAATVNVQFTDDDYQTWSTARSVSMNTPRPILYQTGQSRRRAVLLTSYDANPLALEYIEFENIEQGE